LLRIIVDSPQNNGQLEEQRISSLDAPFFAYVYNIYPIIIVRIMSSFSLFVDISYSVTREPSDPM
jgi:hypothetical protein